MSWKRATTPEAIEQRRSSIVGAARKLFRKLSYEEISLNNIASEAGTAKSNVYRYFETREEIFLTIYISVLRSWSSEILSAYQSLPKNASPHLLAESFVSTTLKHEEMLGLTSFLSTSIEKNSSKEQLRDFKKISLEICLSHYKELQRIYEELSLEEVTFFMKMIYASMATFWAEKKSNRELKKILKEDEFKTIVPDFKSELTKAIEISMRGILSYHRA